MGTIRLQEGEVPRPRRVLAELARQEAEWEKTKSISWPRRAMRWLRERIGG